MATYENDDDKTKYQCSKCKWVGTVKEMEQGSDCGDPDDAVYSDYCCPKCGMFYLIIEYWDKFNETITDEEIKISVQRTGEVKGPASSEYLVRFPDNTTMTIWSPVWHDWTNDEEDEKALKFAKTTWYNRQNKDSS
jgi:hypothetical protein